MEAVIIDAVRTPLGRRNGGLSGVHPADLSATVLRALAERTGLDPARVDDVIWGCVSQTGEQSVNIGRNAVLAAGWPVEVPATTIDRQCGSSQQAAHFAAGGVLSGQYDVVIAGGVESMSRVPMLCTVDQGPGEPFSPTISERLGTSFPNQGVSAEIIAKKWSVSREELDRISLQSHRRAAAAVDSGAFDGEIIPVITEVDGQKVVVSADEGIRRETSMEVLGGLRSAYQENGIVTAGNSSQISDGAAAVLIASAEAAERLGLTPIARFRSFALAGVDPIEMLTGPIPATRKLVERSGIGLDQIDSFEVNEAFASVVAAWLAETGVDEERVNPNGGAIALGHPLGGSGARLLTTLVHHLRRTGGRFGLQTMCEGGGMANATLIERL
ncbi:MAG: thiolase family protein [Microthrixaceae bacterium]